MWWVGAKTLDVYVGTRALAVCQGAETLASQSVADFEAALVALRLWLKAAPARLKLRLWLSGGVCRPFLVPPVPGVSAALELQRVATALAPKQTGLLDTCRVWVDSGPTAAQARVAVAMQQSRHEQLLQMLNDIGARKVLVLAMRPWWGDLLRAALLREPDALAVAAQDCDSLTVLVGRGDGYEVATTLTPVVDRPTAEAALARMLLSADVGAGQEVVGRLLIERVQGEAALAHESRSVALGPLVEFSR